MAFDETLAAWRARGAQGVDPVRFRFIEALARRATAQQGDARRLLEQRLAGLLADYGERFERARAASSAVLSESSAAGAASTPARNTVPVTPGSSSTSPSTGTGNVDSSARGTGSEHASRPLAGLLQYLAQQAAASVPGGIPDDAAGESSPRRVEPAESAVELRTLRHFRSTWARLSVDRRLSQSLAREPENAGPLNSHALALRSLRMMQDISPAYLDRFVSYVDALMWLDQANGSSAPMQRDVVHDVTRAADVDRKPRGGRRKAG